MMAALLLDLTLGDPPNRWHPVAWMGSVIGRLQRNIPTDGKIKPLLGGTLIAWGGAACAWGIGRSVQRLPSPMRWPLEVVLLKSTFSLRGLVRAAEDVEHALEVDDLEQARHWLGWHLVSRDTSQLNESQVSAATIESLAENLSDGVIAPLLYFRAGGLPLALAYRYINTCDAMLGYRDARREWLGKCAARTDDLLNLLPARLTALGILVSGGSQRSISVYRRDRNKTTSPNAGHPMSAMAGALGVELEKVGQYRLGAGLREPGSTDIRRAIHKINLTATLIVSVILLPTK